MRSLRPALLTCTALVALGSGSARAACVQTGSEPVVITCDTAAPNPDLSGVVREDDAVQVKVLSGAQVQGVSGAAGWQVGNEGEVFSDQRGVVLGAGSTVENATGGIVTGQWDGVVLSGGGGTVTNSGSIEGTTNDGVNLEGGGTVVNNASGALKGTITGRSAGVRVVGGARGTVTNAGDITSAGGRAVFMQSGGRVTNQAGGSLSGSTLGVEIQSGTSTVDNAGTIRGDTEGGVFLGGGGTLTNAATGQIAGATYGVRLEAASGTVTNAGSITGGSDGGVELAAGGVVENQTGGTITGVNSILILGLGEVTNNGSLVATGAAGVVMSAGGTVDNQADGTIVGVTDGLQVSDGSLTLTNAGRIQGRNNAGVRLDNIELPDDGFANSGEIVGQTSGVVVLARAGAIGNSGRIRGETAAAVVLGQGGSLTNATGGEVSGAEQGLLAQAATVVSNAGKIVGDAMDGVLLMLGGTIDNQAGGEITGQQNGIAIAGAAGSLTNRGTVTGLTADGVTLTAGGQVDNFGEADARGSISGVVNGISATGGSVVVTNAGDLSGRDGDGGTFADGAKVTNVAGGAISGGLAGLRFAGVTATLDNAGTVTGGSDAAVVMAQGGVISNQATGGLTGALGVSVSGGAAELQNGGSITGTSGAGATFSAGATVSSSGSINGATDGLVVTGATGGIDNSGVVTGRNGDGIRLAAGGRITNSGDGSTSGIIEGSDRGVALDAGGALSNGAVVRGKTGVSLAGLASLQNVEGGRIIGSETGVAATGSDITVANSGSITGESARGLSLEGGTVTNSATGAITGATDGLAFTAEGSLQNAGTVSGTGGAGARFAATGSLTNYQGGQLSGTEAAVAFAGDGGSVENAGNLSSGAGTGISFGGAGGLANYEGGRIDGGTAGVAAAGALQLGNSGAIASMGDGLLLSQGGTVFNNATGTISGGSAAIRVLDGAFTLRNEGTVEGDVLMGPGDSTLAITETSQFTGRVDAEGGSNTLILAGDGATYDGAFTGFQSLQVGSDGTWTLTGDQSYAAGTSVGTGTLDVEGVLDSATSVASGAVLRGTGRVASATVAGNIQPGTATSIGTLTVDGDLTFADGGTYTARVQPDGSHDQLVVGGAAALDGGSLDLALADGTYRLGSSYTLLQAGAVSGTLASEPVASDLPFLSFDPVTTADSVALQVNRSSTSFTTAAGSKASREVAKVFDALPTSGTALDQALSDLASLDTAGASNALDSLNGEVYGSNASADLMAGLNQLDRLQRHVSRRRNTPAAGWLQPDRQLAEAPPVPSQTAQAAVSDTVLIPMPMPTLGYGPWIEAYGSRGKLDGKDGGANADVDGYGATVGFDVPIDEHRAIVGLAVGVDQRNLKLDGGSDQKVDTTSYSVGAYGGFDVGKVTVDAALSYTRHDGDSRRRIELGTPVTAKGNPEADQFSGGLEVGYRIETFNTALKPYASITGTRLNSKSFKESDAGALALDVDSKTSDSVRAGIGLEAAAVLSTDLASELRIVPTADLRYSHALVSPDGEVDMAFASTPGTGFTSQGAVPGSDRLDLGLGLQFDFNRNWALRAGYQGSFSQDDQNHAGLVTVRYRW